LSEGGETVDLAFDGTSWWSYAAVFVAAAVPVVEILVVIPAGIIAGLAPLPTAMIALAGNLTTVVLVGFAGDRLLGWWRRIRRDRAMPPEPGPDPGAEPVRSRRADRAGHLVRRWGVPGLALLAPVTTGTHLAVIAALATGDGRSRVLGWMAFGLAAWAVVVTTGAVLGVGLLS
jgi:uncharacterized membrane protein